MYFCFSALGRGLAMQWQIVKPTKLGQAATNREKEKGKTTPNQRTNCEPEWVWQKHRNVIFNVDRVSYSEWGRREECKRRVALVHNTSFQHLLCGWHLNWKPPLALVRKAVIKRPNIAKRRVLWQSDISRFIWNAVKDLFTIFRTFNLLQTWNLQLGIR